MLKQFSDFDSENLRERRLVFEAAENLDNSDLQARAAEMSRQEAYNQLPLGEFETANKFGWFNDSVPVPPDGSRADVEKPNLEVIDGGGDEKNQAKEWSDTEKKKFSKEEQSELAKLEGRADGNIMQVGADNLEIMQTVLRSRDDIARILEHEVRRRPDMTNDQAAQASFVMNTLVTEQMRSQIEEMERKIHRTRTGGREISEEKLKKKVDARIHGKHMRGMPAGRQWFSRQGGLNREGRQGSPRFTEGLDIRIRTIENYLQNPNDPRALMRMQRRVDTRPEWNRDALETELIELRKLRTNWSKVEKNIRGEMLTIKRTDKRVLSRTFAFINPDGEATHTTEDFITNGGILNVDQRRILTGITRDPEAQRRLMDANPEVNPATGDLITAETYQAWLDSNPELTLRNDDGTERQVNFSALTANEQMFVRELQPASGLPTNDATEYIATYRNLNTVVSYDDTAKWREDSHMRMLLSLLENSEYRTLFNGTGNVDGIDISGGVIGRFSEHSKVQLEIDEIDEELTRIRTQIGSVPSIESARRALDDDNVEVESSKRRLDGQKKNIEDLRALLSELANAAREYNEAADEVANIEGQVRTAPTKQQQSLLERQKDQQAICRKSQDKVSRANAAINVLSLAEQDYATRNGLADPNPRNSVALNGARRYELGDVTTVISEFDRDQDVLTGLKSELRNAEDHQKSLASIHRGGIKSSEASSGSLHQRERELQDKRSDLIKTQDVERANNQPHYISPQESVTQLIELKNRVDWCKKNGRNNVNEVPKAQQKVTRENAEGRVHALSEDIDGGNKNIAATLEQALENRPETMKKWVRQQPGRVWDWLQKPVGETWGGKKLAQGKELAGKGVKKTVTGGKILGGFANRIFRSVSPS
jgi:hypothetical protein